MREGVCRAVRCVIVHRAHYELFIRALDAPNVSDSAVCLVHPTCGPTQVRVVGGVWSSDWLTALPCSPLMSPSSHITKRAQPQSSLLRGPFPSLTPFLDESTG